jgi:2-methylfumaryl-CoA hydratase
VNAPEKGTEMTSKTFAGNFFEDFRVGQVLRHATPRTVSEGDVALYTALYGPRFAINSSDEFARSLGLPRAPIDDVLVFHMVFGKTVPDVSLNAVANLGYANGRFGVPVFPGDTISTTSTVTGLKQNSNGKTGVVYVHSVGKNQHGSIVLEYTRWVMVNKRDVEKPAQQERVPNLPENVTGGELHLPQGLHLENYDFVLAGSKLTWNDYDVGERIDHVDGMTIEEAEHQLATRLYQNTAKVHFDQLAADAGRFKRRLIYGGHIISLARCLSFNGLANAFRMLAINGGSHANPTFAGDTIYAYSEVLEKIELPQRSDVGALRLRLVATKNAPAGKFPYKQSGKYDDSVVLDLDYTAALPR